MGGNNSTQNITKEDIVNKTNDITTNIKNEINNTIVNTMSNVVKSDNVTNIEISNMDCGGDFNYEGSNSTNTLNITTVGDFQNNIKTSLETSMNETIEGEFNDLEANSENVELGASSNDETINLDTTSITEIKNIVKKITENVINLEVINECLNVVYPKNIENVKLEDIYAGGACNINLGDKINEITQSSKCNFLNEIENAIVISFSNMLNESIVFKEENKKVVKDKLLEGVADVVGEVSDGVVGLAEVVTGSKAMTDIAGGVIGVADALLSDSDPPQNNDGDEDKGIQIEDVQKYIFGVIGIFIFFVILYFLYKLMKK